MIWAQLAIAGLLLACGGLGMAANLLILFRTARGHHAPSPLPLLPGVIAAVGVALLPSLAAWPWALLPVGMESGIEMAILWFSGRNRGSRE